MSVGRGVWVCVSWVVSWLNVCVSSCCVVSCVGMVVDAVGVIAIFELLNIASDGGSGGSITGGSLFILNTLLSSSLYDPGLAIFIKWECRNNAIIFVATSLSSVGKEVEVLLVVVVVFEAVTLLKVLLSDSFFCFIFSPFIFLLSGELLARVRCSLPQLMHFLVLFLHLCQ